MARQSKVLTISGWVLTVLLAGLFLFSAAFKLLNPPEMQKDWVEKLGYPASALMPIGITEAVCAILFLIPRTSVIGAILLTGYLGGAIATHVRLSEVIFMQSLMGALIWLALFLRDRRIRQLIPIRCKEVG